MGNTMDPPGDVIVVILDSLRADRCSCYGYEEPMTPNLDAIARTGVRYSKVYSPASWTVPAVASLLSGNLPSQIGCHTGNETFVSPNGRTLPEQFSAAGFQTVGVSSNPWLSPDFGFGVGFDKFSSAEPDLPFPTAGNPRDVNFSNSLPGKVSDLLRWSWRGNPMSRVANALSYKLSVPYADGGEVNDVIFPRISGTDEDIFLLVNYMDAHEPYTDTGTLGSLLRDGGSDVTWNLGSLDESPTVTNEEISNLYDRAVQRVDEYFGALVEFLDQKGRLDESLLIILGDHGQSLGERGYWGHGNFLYDELLKVPLVIKPPASWATRPTVIERPTSFPNLFDIASAVLDDPDIDGRSDGCGFFVPPRDEPLVSESHGQVQDLDVDSLEVDYTRARRIRQRGVDITFFHSTDEAHVRISGDIGERNLRSTFDDLVAIDEDLGNLVPDDGLSDEIAGGAKQRLADLGYL
jgi:arylsulfatase A-like enzyme